MYKNSLIIGIVLLFSFVFTAYTQDIIVGAEQTENYFSILKDKRIAIVANHTSRIKNIHLVDSLRSAGFDIKRIFTPEHGLRGTADAGEEINNSIDKKSKIPVTSLYGNNKKPKKENLQNIDLVIFDIQDVGVRFYTYISTLHYVMESCSENEIPLMILDRPNPNGFYIDGPILNLKHRSFIGMHPIPVVHGLTIGELAQMINGEEWIEKQCDLHIIICKNYNHTKKYNLPLPPSPNLPNMQSVYLYPSLGLFEGTIMSVGRGTAMPFQVYGHPEYTEKEFSFTPQPTAGATSPKYQGKVCYGQNFTPKIEGSIPTQGVDLSYIVDAMKKTNTNKSFFNSVFTRLSGNNTLQQDLEKGKDINQIKASWLMDINKYKQMRKKYLLYDDFE